MSHTRRFVCGLAVVAVGTAGCAAATVSGHGSAAPSLTASPSASGFPSIAPEPSVVTPIAPVSPSSAGPVRLATEDIKDVRWRVPSGFVKTRAFHPVTPLEHRWRSGYLVPRNERRGLDVIGIVLYTLPSWLRLSTIATQKARVRYYNSRTDARAIHGLHVAVIADWPAIQENAIEQGTYRYAAWYVFSRHHLALVTCQVDQQVNKIARGCQSVIDSLKFR